jgi:hypothetical protein
MLCKAGCGQIVATAARTPSAFEGLVNDVILLEKES